MFPAHITGKFPLIGDLLARASDGYALKLLASGAFVVAIAGAQVVAHRRRARAREVLRPLLILEAALIAGFAAVVWLAEPQGDVDPAWAVCAAVLGAAAMGLQSASLNLPRPDLDPRQP
ncbi:DUF1275 family protein [Variovorax sp. J22P168]|uniref:DUF1275 family protein n=1 Tax=Variovorax jilinensis TaxID=3053513 RepID=UPI0025758CC9|nr:DUF1275 family protein [Variovorax sp. J22P168]MDM0015229.1 DUF1275 family protein [Variovorax sp. J22P168]